MSKPGGSPSGQAITHPDKVLFPDAGISKAELAAYYQTVAPIMLPHLTGRPITMERFPAGIGKSGFLQKDVSRGFPAWLERVEVPKQGGVVHHPVVRDARDLLWIANQNCITLHVWTSRAPRLYQPDLCVFDLDPADEDPVQLRQAALAVRDLLAELGLASWVKTSGSKGYHIVVPLDVEAGFEEVALFAHGVGGVLVKRDPEHLIQEFNKADREGRIFVDTGRNGYSATFAAHYAVRPKPGAPVSVPCSWDEVESGAAGPRTFRLRSMSERLAQVGDLWAGLLDRGYSLREPTDRLNRLLTEAEWRESLAARTRRPGPRKRSA